MLSDKNSGDKKQTNTNVKTLVFHKLLPRFSFGSTNFSPLRFEKLLIKLSKDGYSFTSLDKISSTHDQKTLLITFDDGYQHLQKYLPSLMEKYHFRPLIFISSYYIGKNNKWDYSYLFQNTPHLNREDIKYLSELGADFGSHGHHHRSLTKLSLSSLGEELRVSKDIIENITKKEVISISYPFGRFNQQVMENVKEAGYHFGFTMNFPTLNDNQLSIGRYAIYGYDTLFTINQKLSHGFLYPLEKFKARFTNKLSNGTLLYKRLTRYNETDKKL
ncbi:MAG: polysaccharide deacetylase family protein [FCB group bacterium]|nr:polysaccharide deacetylase family protein [FCB group bacterium]